MPRSAGADGAVTPERIDRLHDAYYDERVLEYCGFLTAEVYDGYERLVRYLLLTADIDIETDRRIRISAWTDADYQYDDHSLSGQHVWCATDGRKAEQEFLDFRRRQLSGRQG